MKQFKGVVICLLMLSLVAVASTWAKGPAGVKNTVHNLSSTDNLFFAYVSNTDEVCVFCHTPHGGSLSGPLWNRSLPTAGFTHYNSSTLSLSGLGYVDNRTVGDESLLCLSCHDGSVALGHLLNPPNSLNGADIVFAGGVTEILPQGAGVPGPRIGGSAANSAGTGDLSDDHPISFSYKDVVDQAIYQTNGAREGELRHIGDTSDTASVLGYKGEGVRLFGSEFRVECSSCHDPHVDYDFPLSASGNPAYRPFLIRPNSASDLCLSCHNK